MKKYSGIFLSDQVSKDGFQFTIPALEDAIWQGSVSGTPTNISHDVHRTAGWSFTKGLLFTPTKVLVMGCTWIPESEDDYKAISDAKGKFFANYINKQIQIHHSKFIDALKDLYIDEKGNWFYNSIVLYGYDDIVFKAFPDLFNRLDKDGLIEVDYLLKEFEHLSQGVFRKKGSEITIMLHPYFRKSASIFNNYNWAFIDEFLSLNDERNIKAKVKIDSNFLGYFPSFIPSMEFEYWWGPKYNDDISSIPMGLTTYGGDDEFEKLFSNVVRTEFIWKNEAELYTFEMEEVKDEPAPTLKDTYACRYIHSIYDNKNKNFNHFDGAIRAYDTDLMIERLDKKMTEMGRRSEYTKLFRIDGELPLSSWKSLVTKYLQGNPQIYEYFGIPKPDSIIEKADEPKTTFEKYLPYSINKGEGVRLYVSYRDKVEPKPVDRYISSYDQITLESGKYNAVEYFTVELVKAIKRVGANIDMPTDCLFVIPEDYYCNMPCMTHSDKNTQKLVNETIDGIRLLVSQLLKNNSNEIISFSLSWNMEEKEVLVSFIGHIEDLNTWLKTFECIPVQRSDFKKWLTTQSDFFKESGIENPCPVLSEVTKDDGMLYFTRRLVDRDAAMSFPNNDFSQCEFKFDEGKEDLAELVKTQQIYVAPSVQVIKMICEKTGLDYIDSPYSIIFNETQQIFENCKILCFYWTDKPRPISIG